jgi:phosphohistidine phosphatase
MNKRLILIRHGNARPASDERSDFERPLSGWGEQEARVVGERLAHSAWIPQLIITSSAPRALATARVVAGCLREPPLIADPALFLASPEALRRGIARHADDQQSVAVVAHNPGLSYLVRDLSDAELDALPTAGVVGIAFEADDWGSLAGGWLGYFDSPLRQAPYVR